MKPRSITEAAAPIRVPKQTNILDRLPLGGRVAVIRLRSLGDCVLTTPALRLLGEARPDLEVRVVVEERFAGVFGDRALPPRVSDLRAFRPDLCLNLHGGTRSARLSLLSGARFRAGFDIFRPRWIYNLPIPTAQVILGIERRVHTAEHLAAAVFYLGSPIREVPRAFVPVAGGRSSHAPDSPYAVIHAFAATAVKAWPSDRFLATAAHLERSTGLTPVFIGGPGDDLSPFAAHHRVPGAPLDELAKLMRDAALFVGNDSGPAHVAAAFGVPQVVLFGPSDSEVWAPWRTENEIITSDDAIADISVERVIKAAEALTRRAPVRAGRIPA